MPWPARIEVDKPKGSGYCYAIRFSRLSVMLFHASRTITTIIITGTTMGGTGAG